MTKSDEFTVVVPARLAAQRLPRKPLADINGTPMLVRVLQQAAASGAARVVAACAEEELAEVVRAAGFTALLTGEHPSGSSRVAEAATLLNLPQDAIVVNVQGDEPFMEPEVIAATAARARAVECACATPCRTARSEEEAADPSVVKVVGDRDNFAAYFSRACIPHRRGDGSNGMAALRVHLGLYAYRLAALRRYTALPPAPTEQAEQLEQLRVLWHGGRIALHDCASESFGIDTEADLARARDRAAVQTTQ